MQHPNQKRTDRNVALFSHFDSRGGTTAIPCGTKTVAEAAFHYVHMCFGYTVADPEWADHVNTALAAELELVDFVWLDDPGENPIQNNLELLADYGGGWLAWRVEWGLSGHGIWNEYPSPTIFLTRVPAGTAPEDVDSETPPAQHEQWEEGKWSFRLVPANLGEDACGIVTLTF